jgi:threonine aldolase
MIDLRSDTVTRPSDAMRLAMAHAEVGDDVLGDDPTVQRLESVCAERSGKEAALFTPSGSMANLIALTLLTRKGDEVLQEGGSHPFNYEAAGASVVAGVQIRPLPGDRGVLDVATVEAAIRPPNDHFAPATLLTLEDTANRGGGTVYPLERLDALTALARERGLQVHLDGARVFNAVVKSQVPLARRARDMDTVSFCFSKGLGAPVGSVLCGDRDAMVVARRIR